MNALSVESFLFDLQSQYPHFLSLLSVFFKIFLFFFRKLATFDQKDHMKFHIAMDNMVVIDEIKASARSGSETCLWNPLILVIPLRLGLTEVNPVYFQDLKVKINTKTSIFESLFSTQFRFSLSLELASCC